jgi:uncharacterized protein YjlB
MVFGNLLTKCQKDWFQTWIGNVFLFGKSETQIHIVVVVGEKLKNCETVDRAKSEKIRFRIL